MLGSAACKARAIGSPAKQPALATARPAAHLHERHRLHQAAVRHVHRRLALVLCQRTEAHDGRQGGQLPQTQRQHTAPEKGQGYCLRIHRHKQATATLSPCLHARCAGGAEKPCRTTKPSARGSSSQPLQQLACRYVRMSAMSCSTEGGTSTASRARSLHTGKGRTTRHLFCACMFPSIPHRVGRPAWVSGDRSNAGTRAAGLRLVR